MSKLMRILVLAAMMAATPALAADPRADAVPANPQKDAFFGELHLHTSYSLDSYIFGNPIDPVMAYGFARGKPITLYGGMVKQLRTPLDFAAVTDHSEFLGELALCTTPGSSGYDSDMCRKIRVFDHGQFDRIANSVSGKEKKHIAELCGSDGKLCTDAARSTWKRHQEIAERFYEPGKFTTLLGYEYSPNLEQLPGVVGFTMLHRNVIFRTAQVPADVFSAYDGTGEELHRWMETKCTEPCRALVIPHNSNASSGRFFWDAKNSDGSPWTKEGLERRARVEPLVEIFQSKGSSECQAGLGLADEECGFENWVAPCPPGQELGCAVPDSFVQNAIVHGLAVERKWGVNPFKYGFIGASDSHNGNPGGVEENDYKGELGNQDNTAAKRLLGPGQKANAVADPDMGPAPAQGSRMAGFNPGGLAGVWAEKNTREAIWDALARKETFGTSGTRIRVRFFGGFDLPKGMDHSPDLAAVGYQKGVPMGGTLSAVRGKAPSFVVWAVRDPDSAPLQKIQIVKGWVEGDQSRLKVTDVVCSDGILPDQKTGLCRDNGASVDLATCEQQGGKGAAELAGTWTDPFFDARQRAVYYVRVFENPVCRWTTYQAHELGVPPPKNFPATVRERAWTSPIWYAPR